MVERQPKTIISHLPAGSVRTIESSHNGFILITLSSTACTSGHRAAGFKSDSFSRSAAASASTAFLSAAACSLLVVVFCNHKKKNRHKKSTH